MSLTSCAPSAGPVRRLEEPEGDRSPCSGDTNPRGLIGWIPQYRLLVLFRLYFGRPLVFPLYRRLLLGRPLDRRFR